MLVTEQDLADLNKILNARGYWVMTTAHLFSPGEIVKQDDFYIQGRLIKQPAIVVRETDYADWAAHCAVVGWNPASHPSERFYRVVTD